MEQMFDARGPTTVPTTINVNVVFSGKIALTLGGHAVLEILSTTTTVDDPAAAAALKGLTAGLTPATATLTEATAANPVPTP